MDSERFQHAVALRDTGNEEDALREFEALADLESDPHEKADLIGNQANCLSRLGRLKEARQRLSKAERIGGPSPFRDFLDAYMTVTEGNREEAVEKLTVALRKHRDLKESDHRKAYFDAQDELAWLLYGLGRYADAVSAFEEALTSAAGDQHKKLSCYLGICYYKTGKLKDAEEKLIQSLPDSPADSWWFSAQYELGCTYFGQGAYVKAKKTFELCAFYVNENDVEMKENVSRWLAETRVKLGERGNPVH